MNIIIIANTKLSLLDIENRIIRKQCVPINIKYVQEWKRLTTSEILSEILITEDMPGYCSVLAALSCLLLSSGKWRVKSERFIWNPRICNRGALKLPVRDLLSHYYQRYHYSHRQWCYTCRVRGIHQQNTEFGIIFVCDLIYFGSKGSKIRQTIKVYFTHHLIILQ